MTINDALSRLALEHDIELAEPTTPHSDIALTTPDTPEPTDYEIKTAPHNLKPSTVRRLAAAAIHHPNLLLLTPEASAETLDTARTLGISVIVADSPTPRGHLISRHGTVYELHHHAPDTPKPTRRPGRTPWLMYAVALERATNPHAKQVATAQKLGVTQGAVSQALHKLNKLYPWERELRQHRTDGDGPGAHAQTQRALLHAVAAHYPQPARASTTWRTLDSPNDTARATSQVLTEHRVRHAVSGQVAADLLAPWARPQQVLIWAEKLTDLSDANATPVTAEDANLILAVPEDPYLLRVTQTVQDLPVLEPLRVWLDLTRNGDTQAAEALQRQLAATTQATS